jgi:hypothetical protein
MVHGYYQNAKLKIGHFSQGNTAYIGGSYKTSYYTAMRVRIGMLVKGTKLNCMTEMDESYFGGKARKMEKSEDNEANLATTTLK